MDVGLPRNMYSDRQALLGWLTVERAAYGGAVLFALALRLLLLGVRPLVPAEAAQALAALAASAGREFDVAGVSPLLFTLQRLLFAPWGASDVLARWWPALLGGLAPLLFFWLRRPLGRGGALAAAYLWALSPMAIFTGRLGLGDGLVPPLALAALAGVASGVHAESPAKVQRPFLFAAGALGLLLAAAPGGYTVLLCAVVAAYIWRGSLPAFAGLLRPHWRSILAAFAVCLVAGATFFFAVPGGLAAAADLLGDWLHRLEPGAGGYRAWEILLRLLLSEPLLVGLGVAGLVQAVRRRDRFGIFAAAAAGLAMAISLIGRGRHPADLGLVVLALTLLAGPVAARALGAAWSWRRETDPWLLVTGSLILVASAALCLPGAFNPANNETWRQLYTSVGIVTAVLAVLLWVVYGVWGSWRTVGLALPPVLLLVGLLWGFGQATGLNYDRGAWRQSGVLHEEAAPGWADLHGELRDLASLHGRGAGEAAIDLVLPPTRRDSLQPALRWALRGFPNVRLVPSVAPTAAPVVITLPEEQPRLGTRYSGTEITVLPRWAPSRLANGYARLRWVLYREVTEPPEGRSVVLWVQRTESEAATGGWGTAEEGLPADMELNP